MIVVKQTSQTEENLNHVIFKPFNKNDKSTHMEKTEFFDDLLKTIPTKMASKSSHHYNICKEQLKFILSNGANENINNNGGGTTGALNKISHQLFDNLTELKTNYNTSSANTNELNKFQKACSSQQKSEYDIMRPYWCNKEIDYQGYKIAGVNHVISLNDPKALQMSNIYQNVFINNIKSIIKNANNISTNDKEHIYCLYLCSTPGSIYNGYMWLNTYLMISAIKELNIQINDRLYIVIDGQYEDIAIAKTFIKGFENQTINSSKLSQIQKQHDNERNQSTNTMNIYKGKEILKAINNEPNEKDILKHYDTFNFNYLIIVLLIAIIIYIIIQNYSEIFKEQFDEISEA